MPDGIMTADVRIPWSERAEQLVAAAVLSGRMEAVEALRPEHFFDPAHACLFAAAMAMHERGETVTPIALHRALVNDDQVKQAGGQPWLASLAAAIWAPEELKGAVAEVRDSATRRGLIDLADSLRARAVTGGLDGAGLIVREAEEVLYRLGEEGTAASRPKALSEIAGGYVAAVERAWQHRGEVTGVTTGLADLDRMICGLQPTDLIILAGRPAMGKSAIAINRWAVSAARAGKRTLVLNYEMGGEQLMGRMVSAATGIDGQRQRSGRINQHEFMAIHEATADLSRLPLHIEENPPHSMAGLRTLVRRHKRRHGLDLLIIDYLQLMRDDRRLKGDNRTNELSEITRALKSIAKELQVPVVALSQLSRAVEQRDDKRPVLSDLRESGSIEQDADIVMFVYRESYYLERAEPSRRADESEEKYASRVATWQARIAECEGVGEVIIAKHRHGPTGAVRLAWDGARQLFSDLYQGDDRGEN